MNYEPVEIERASKTLHRMKGLLSDEKKWCQKTPARDVQGLKINPFVQGACSWCLSGAYHKCKVLRDGLTWSILQDNLPEGFDNVIVFNDDANTSYRDISDLLERSINQLNNLSNQNQE